MLKGKRYKKSNAKQIILSVTALLVILLVAAGITYSWIEGGDTFTIQTGSDTDVQTATKPNTQVKKGLKIDPLSNNTISLNENFDKTTNASQDLYFSPVSGDGENFFFATKFNNDGVASAFRPANTNDIGTKFINYNFNITTEKKCYLAFDGKPKFIVRKNGSVVNDIDTSAFRIMLKSGDEKHVLTTADNATTDTVVTNAGGTSTKNVQVKSVKDYVYNSSNNNKLFKYEANQNGNVEVSVWLDGQNSESALLGSEIDVDMRLKVSQEIFKTKVYVEPRTENFTPYHGYAYNDAETVYEFGAWPGTPMLKDIETNYYYLKKDDTSDSYNFIVNNGKSGGAAGALQYPSGDSSTKLKLDTTGEPDANGYYTYVLRNDGTWETFDDTKVKVSAETKVFKNDGITTQLSGTTKGTISINGETGKTSSIKTVYYDKGTTELTLTADAKTHYKFIGWYENPDCTGTPVQTENTFTYTVDNKTRKSYYAKFIEDPKYTVTFGASTFEDGVQVDDGFTGGKIRINGTERTAQYTAEFYVDTAINGNPIANTGYTFDGWYSNSECTGTKLNSLNTTVKGNARYYAKFVANPKHEIRLQAVTAPSGTGGTFTINGTAGTTYTEKQGMSVTIKAIPSAGYRFVGWYTNIGCTGQLGSDYTNPEQTVTIGSQELTFYYAKFIKTYNVTLKSVTDGVLNGNGGTVQAGNASAGATSVTAADYNSNVNIKASVKQGYKFDGFYTAQTGGELVTSLPDGYKVTATSDLTYFARFTTNTQTTTIYIVPNNTYSPYYVYAYGATTQTKYNGAWEEKKVKAVLDSATGYYKTTFTTSETGEFRVIIHNGNGAQYPASGVEGRKGTIGGTYLFTFDSTGDLKPFDSTTYTVTLKAKTDGVVSSTGGTVQIDSAASGASSSKSVLSGSEVTLKATPKSGYTFDGIYNSSDQKVSSGTNTSCTVKVTGNAEYYAKFVKNAGKTSTTIYVESRNYATHYLHVYNESGTKQYTAKGGWPGDKLELDSATGLYKYTFETDDPAGTKFFVIVNNNAGSQYPSGDNLYGEIGGTYLFKSGSPTGLMPTYTPVSNNYVYFDSSACSWFESDSAVLAVSTDNGTSYIAAKTITSSGKKYWYYNLPSGTTSFRIGRKTSSGIWNTFSVTRSGTNNLYTINSGCTGGSWSKYTGTTPN